MSRAGHPGDALTGRLARIRQRLEASSDSSPAVSACERWVDVGPLLELEGTDFIRAAYLRVLGRQADSEGLRHNIAELHSGAITKPELLRALASSAEGRQYGVHFTGLTALLPPHSFESRAGAPAHNFVRAVGRFYNGCEPSEDSLARWVELIETGSVSREDVIRLFAFSAHPQKSVDATAAEMDALASTLSEVRQELDSHQRMLEALTRHK